MLDRHIKTITTDRLRLRQWHDHDLTSLVLMNGDPEVMKHFPSVLTEQESSKQLLRIRDHFEKYGFGLFAVERLSDNEFLGFTGFSTPNFQASFTPCTEIGWRYKKSAWGNGYATEAAKACLQLGFRELKFDEVYSFTTKVNKASEKVMIRIGMKFIEEFDHPSIQAEHVLRRHLLYKK